MNEHGVTQVLMLDVLVPDFEKWLAARGLMLMPDMIFEEGEMPTRIVGPTEERVRAFQPD